MLRPLPTTNGQQHQSGAVLLGVMVVIFASMMLVGILVDEYLGVEARALDRHLASVRGRWALSGHVDYVLSRARNYGDAPGYANHDDLRITLGGFANDVPQDVYDYATAGVDLYRFQVNTVARDQDAPAVDGRVRLDLDLAPVAGVVPLLQDIANREPGITVVACIGSEVVTNRTANSACLAGAGDPGVTTVISYESR